MQGPILDVNLTFIASIYLIVINKQLLLVLLSCELFVFICFSSFEPGIANAISSFKWRKQYAYNK